MIATLAIAEGAAAGRPASTCETVTRRFTIDRAGSRENTQAGQLDKDNIYV